MQRIRPVADIVRLSTQQKETHFVRARVAPLFVVLADKFEASTFTEEAGGSCFLVSDCAPVHLCTTSAARANKSSCHPMSAYPHCANIPCDSKPRSAFRGEGSQSQSPHARAESTMRRLHGCWFRAELERSPSVMPRWIPGRGGHYLIESKRQLSAPRSQGAVERARKPSWLGKSQNAASNRYEH